MKWPVGKGDAAPTRGADLEDRVATLGDQVDALGNEVVGLRDQAGAEAKDARWYRNPAWVSAIVTAVLVLFTIVWNTKAWKVFEHPRPKQSVPRQRSS